MNYDTWKADAPDPGTGGGGPNPTPAQAFWHTYEYVRRQHCVDAFLDAHRDKGPFAALVLEVEAQWQCQCGTWLPRGPAHICGDCREAFAEDSGSPEHAS